MDKKLLIGVSICAVVLLILGSLSNVVGYQSVQSSNQQIINEEINQRELLFQTICDITNNKEIQRIILKSQMSRGIFPVSNIPVFTKNYLKQMYFVGLILLKLISLPRIQSMVQHQNQILNPERQQEISTAIENNPLFKGEKTQLQHANCNCENENSLRWNFPIICGILGFFGKIGVTLLFFQGLHIIGLIIISIIIPLLRIFNCI
ncbi:MAG: hypothetical protein NTY91_01330 [Euryarchaeota archaeon]|nr:hypothetical protein [Euryarchaeota archaeon]